MTYRKITWSTIICKIVEVFKSKRTGKQAIVTTISYDERTPEQFSHSTEGPQTLNRVLDGGGFEFDGRNDNVELDWR
jgi:hypothetical protein